MISANCTGLLKRTRPHIAPYFLLVVLLLLLSANGSNQQNIQSTIRKTCDADSLCNATVFTSVDGPGKPPRHVYFSRWKFPEGVYPNLTVDCPTPPQGCSMPTPSQRADAVCLVNATGWWNSLPLLQHFPHAAEVLLPCWNYFTQCVDPASQDLFVITNLSEPVEHLLRKSDWVQSLLETTGIKIRDEIYYRGNRSTSAEKIEAMNCRTLYVKGNRFVAEKLNNWGVGPAAVAKLQEHFGLDINKGGHYSPSDSVKKGQGQVLRVAVLNRKGRRQIDNGMELLSGVQALEQQLLQGIGGARYSSILAEHATMDGMSLREQLHWISTKDIVFTSHGAQNTNLAFLRPCSVVVEAYPPGWYIPEYFMPLVTMVGGLGFTMIDIAESTSSPFDGMRDLKDVEDRRRARNPHVQLTLPVVLQHVLPAVLQAHIQCRDRSQSTNQSLS